MVELLSPVGDFECLKAAVQNGADTVYFGSNSFSARAFASNFSDDDLKKAISYAKIRGVKTNLTLNTLLKNDELPDAIALAEKAYNYGIDAIIVQDLGLARYLIKNFPGLAIHASTQLSVHNLEGVLELQKLGFSRVVLSRELSLQEIEYICQNSNVEIEVFVHGALCISYSGQCLFSSMVGGRSGNRGKCAQPCRLPYELIQTTSDSASTSIDTGYLLSPRDLCGLDYLPSLIKAGVSCLKIEGRMKSPEYVATVTRIYRKYLDFAISHSNVSSISIDEQDKQDLLQVFNRGGFSTGHGFLREPNDIMSYGALAAIAIQSNQNDQHGGQSIPFFDYGLAKGVYKTFRKLYISNMSKALKLFKDIDNKEAIKNIVCKIEDENLKLGLEKNEYYINKEKEILKEEFNIDEDIAKKIQDFAYNEAYEETDRQTYQSMEGFIHNLNTMHSRAGAQVPFSSVNFGTDTSEEGRMISKNLLLCLERGLGDGETPIFPILIFKVKEGINLNPGDPNYDLFKLSCKVSP